MNQTKDFCQLILRLGGVCLVVKDQSQIISVCKFFFLSIGLTSIILMISSGIPKSLTAINSTFLSIESKAFFSSLKFIKNGLPDLNPSNCHDSLARLPVASETKLVGTQNVTVRS